MANPRQKKKRQSRAPKTSKRRALKQRRTVIRGHPAITENWHKDETLLQKLGLTAYSKSIAGGSEATKTNVAEIAPKPRSVGIGEAAVIRDDKGNIVSIVQGEDLVDYVQKPNTSTPNEFVRELESASTIDWGANKRSQSDSERKWIETLIAKHGDDYDAMFWDKNLNLNQQSIGDIRRRAMTWKASVTA